jgi:hypothetical protein
VFRGRLIRIMNVIYALSRFTEQSIDNATERKHTVKVAFYYIKA